MGSIPKIVSTPLKWVSRQVLHRTLLRFPGGDSHDPVACTYCPEMCRFACPTAVASANDAVTPCNKMSLLHKEERWPDRAAAGGPLWPIYDCTGCGRCKEYCVYEMPVADRLFEARARYGWDEGRRVAATISDAEDTVGDLAHELGDVANADRRARWFAEDGAPDAVTEPKSLHFLRSRGVAAAWKFDARLSPVWEGLPQLRDRLQGRAWLVHESVWLSRRLERSGDVATWVKSAQAAGIQLVMPYHHGRDCIDCGGEGAYPRLFPREAATIARDFWERDQHRAQGVLCFSDRCARHLRVTLGADVPVICLADGEE